MYSLIRQGPRFYRAKPTRRLEQRESRSEALGLLSEKVQKEGFEKAGVKHLEGLSNREMGNGIRDKKTPQKDQP